MARSQYVLIMIVREESSPKKLRSGGTEKLAKVTQRREKKNISFIRREEWRK